MKNPLPALCAMLPLALLLRAPHLFTRAMTDGLFVPVSRMLFCRYCDADAVEVFNGGKVRVSRLLSGRSSFPEVRVDGDDGGG